MGISGQKFDVLANIDDIKCNYDGNSFAPIITVLAASAQYKIIERSQDTKVLIVPLI